MIELDIQVTFNIYKANDYKHDLDSRIQIQWECNKNRIVFELGTPTHDDISQCQLCSSVSMHFLSM